MNYLQLTNVALARLNEAQLTSANFSTATAFHDTMKNFINDAIRDINQEEIEWPFNISQQTQALTPGVQQYDLPSSYTSIDWESFFLYMPELLTNGNFTSDITSWTDLSSGTGTAAYTSDGNGRARLAGGASGIGAIEQSVTTISGRQYKLTFRIFTNTVALNIGTSSGGVDILAATDYTIDYTGNGTFYTVYFTATSATTFIEFTNDSDNNADVDYVSCIEDEAPKHLCYIDFDYWRNNYKAQEHNADSGAYTKPSRVTRTQNDDFIISGIPDKAYTIAYDAWSIPTELSAYDDTTTIPTRFEHIIIDRAMFYGHVFRGDNELAVIMHNKYMAGIKRMRIQLINHPDRMKY